jgi:multidrug efflux pump subunit AcrA (membrane-fusion protein)
MKIRYLMVSLALAAVSGLASAAPLAVSEEERQLLGIQVEAVTLLENAGTGSITMRVGFSPDAEWVIKTPFSGVLHRALVQQGDRVKAGDPLVVIRSPEFVALQRDYLKAGAELRMAEAASKRDQRLGEAGSISDRRRQETRYQYDSARADFAGLEGQLAMAGFDAAALKKLAAEAVISPAGQAGAERGAFQECGRATARGYAYPFRGERLRRRHCLRVQRDRSPVTDRDHPRCARQQRESFARAVDGVADAVRGSGFAGALRGGGAVE